MPDRPISTPPGVCPIDHSEPRAAAPGPLQAGPTTPPAQRAFWQYPLPTGPVAERYISGPLPDESGDPEALIAMDPRFTPWAPPFVLKQLQPTFAGTVQGRMCSYSEPRLLGWFGTKQRDFMDLGGTVTIYLGEELEQHSFDVCTLAYIPANTPHGVVVYGHDISAPLMHVDTFPSRSKGSCKLHPELDRRLPDFSKGFPRKSTNPPGGAPPWNPAGGGIYGKYCFSGMNPNSPVKLRPSQIVLVPGDVPGLPLEQSFLFIYAWEDTRMSNVPMHVTHAHPFNENLVYFSTDPDQPHDLGATVTIYAFDTEIKKLVPVDMSKPFISSSARGKHLHCPIIRRNMRRQLGFMWYGTDYDPETFKSGNLEMSVSMQYHNEHYTQGRFNLGEYGVRAADLPDEPEGDGGFLTQIEPHTNWPISKGHDGSNAPLLKIKPRKRNRPAPVADTSPLLPPADVAGIWDFETKTPRGTESGQLVLRVAGNTLSGELIRKEETILLFEGSISGGQLRYRYNITKPLLMRMRAQCAVNGDTMEGKVALTGLGKLPFQARRRARERQP